MEQTVPTISAAASCARTYPASALLTSRRNSPAAEETVYRRRRRDVHDVPDAGSGRAPHERRGGEDDDIQRDEHGPDGNRPLPSAESDPQTYGVDNRNEDVGKKCGEEEENAGALNDPQHVITGR